MDTIKTIAGQLDARDLRIAIVATRFNDFIVNRLVGGALDYLERHGMDFLEVNIIPDTQKRTTMRAWKQGVAVNMETDLIGKYVCNVLGTMRGTPAKGASSSITRAMLLENGFL